MVKAKVRHNVGRRLGRLGCLGEELSSAQPWEFVTEDMGPNSVSDDGSDLGPTEGVGGTLIVQSTARYYEGTQTLDNLAFMVFSVSTCYLK